MNTFEEKGEGALELRDHQLDQVLERQIVALGLVLVVEVLDKLDGHLCVGLGLENVALVDLETKCV